LTLINWACNIEMQIIQVGLLATMMVLNITILIVIANTLNWIAIHLICFVIFFCVLIIRYTMIGYRSCNYVSWKRSEFSSSIWALLKLWCPNYVIVIFLSSFYYLKPFINRPVTLFFIFESVYYTSELFFVKTIFWLVFL